MEASTVTNCKNLLLCSTTTSNGERKKNLAAGLDILQDEMLIAIVSKLTLEEAVRTSVISRRWRYLWQFTSGTLDFDGGYGGKLKDLEVESVEKFQRWVNHILELHQSPSIEKFILRLPLRWGSQCPIYEWISFAMQKEVVSLELDWSDGHFYLLSLEKFLHMCREVRPETLLCRLTSVKLFYVNVDAQLIEYFISNGPRIQNVVVESSKFVEKLAIVGSSLKSFVIRSCSALRSLKVFCPSLKSLDICRCRSLKFLEIGAENLFSLSYHGRRFRPKRFQDVRLLSELEIGGDFCITFLCEPYELFKYSEWLNKIEKLKLCASLEGFGKVLPGPSFSGSSMPLRNLKPLELRITVSSGENFIVFPALMKGFPFLSKFVIELAYIWIYGVQDTYGTGDYKSGAGKGADFEHEGLKVVEIINFYGLRLMDFVLALQLLELAPRLEKMVIHPRSSPTITLSTVRTRVRQLEADVPPSVELVIL